MENFIHEFVAETTEARGVLDQDIATSDAMTLILKCLDRIRELIQALEGPGVEPASDDSARLCELRAKTQPGTPGAALATSIIAMAACLDMKTARAC